MKTQRTGFLVVVMFAVFFISALSAHATLELRGTDTLGNRLIYDTDLNITWYDYTKTGPNGSHLGWAGYMLWADSLDVDFMGTHYTDWRLPSTVDGPASWGYDGSTTVGYNITNSEMGYLFYTELGNNGAYNPNGTLTNCGVSGTTCLRNTGDFQHLYFVPDYYWSGTLIASSGGGSAYLFSFYNGVQGAGGAVNSCCAGYALAVRPGDVSVSGNPVAPEPISSILFVTGGTLLAGRRMLKRGRA